MTPGERIRQRRLELGLSQRNLSGPGLTNTYISRIEKGVRTPSTRALRRLAPKLGVTVEWLECGNPNLLLELTPSEARQLKELLAGLDRGWVVPILEQLPAREVER